jgi:hypothetical protein
MYFMLVNVESSVTGRYGIVGSVLSNLVNFFLPVAEVAE